MNKESWSNQTVWESRYERGEAVNRYPYEPVVSFMQRHFAKLDRGGVRILDYGCGGGNHCAFLAREGFDYRGIDYSPSALKHARETIRSLTGLDPSPDRLLCADFSRLPFGDDHFDAVIDRQSLDQNPAAKLSELVAEIFRVLKPGGRYFGINFSDRHPALCYGRSLGHGDYGEFTTGILKGIGARHFFNADEIRTLFGEFEIEDIRVLCVSSLRNRNNGSEEFSVSAIKPAKRSKGRP